MGAGAAGWPGPLTSSRTGCLGGSRVSGLRESWTVRWKGARSVQSHLLNLPKGEASSRGPPPPRSRRCRTQGCSEVAVEAGSGSAPAVLVRLCPPGDAGNVGCCAGLFCCFHKGNALTRPPGPRSPQCPGRPWPPSPGRLRGPLPPGSARGSALPPHPCGRSRFRNQEVRRAG